MQLRGIALVALGLAVGMGSGCSAADVSNERLEDLQQLGFEIPSLPGEVFREQRVEEECLIDSGDVLAYPGIIHDVWVEAAMDDRSIAERRLTDEIESHGFVRVDPPTILPERYLAYQYRSVGDNPMTILVWQPREVTERDRFPEELEDGITGALDGPLVTYAVELDLAPPYECDPNSSREAVVESNEPRHV